MQVTNDICPIASSSGCNFTHKQNYNTGVPGGSPADAGFAPVCGSTHITRVPGGSPAGAGFALYVCGVYMYACVSILRM